MSYLDLPELKDVIVEYLNCLDIYITSLIHA